MPRFRLFHHETLAVESFDLDQHPQYVAASHAWIDDTLVFEQCDFYDCFDGKGMRAWMQQISPDIRYCWVDRLCINQEDKTDKLEQIPLMEQIYGQTQAVLAFINVELGVDQKRVDLLFGRLRGALKMCKDEAWSEKGHRWQSGAGKARIVRGMQGLLRLASTTWTSRVWTLQEYVLAKEFYWIGLDLHPIQFNDYVMSALPDICDTLQIEECLGPEWRPVYGYLQGMANFRLDDIDRTRVMELTGNRSTNKPADEVYGAMAASGVIITPVAGESKFDAWRRWCEATLTSQNLRWILLPTNDTHLQNMERSQIVSGRGTLFVTTSQHPHVWTPLGLWARSRSLMGL